LSTISGAENLNGYGADSSLNITLRKVSYLLTELDFTRLISCRLLSKGRHEEALRFAEQALRINPFPTGFYSRCLGHAYFHNRKYDEAISALKKSLNLAPKDSLTRMVLTAVYSQAGREDEAQIEAAELLKIRPKFCISRGPRGYKNPADLELMNNALRKAGLPDCPPRGGSK
jgi:Flp pilus assembly protein TadD